MTIEFKIQSVTVSSEDVQEYYPGLIGAIQSHRKRKIYRRRKARKTAAMRIDEIIDSIEVG